MLDIKTCIYLQHLKTRTQQANIKVLLDFNYITNKISGSVARNT